MPESQDPDWWTTRRADQSAPGRWERLFTDVEAEIEEADRADMAAEVSDRSRGEIGELRLVDRLRETIGHPVEVTVVDVSSVSGVLRDVGADWLLLAEHAGPEALVPLSSIAGITGLGAISARPGSEGRVGAKMGLRYALRQLVRDRATMSMSLAGGGVVAGVCDRVGADYVEVAEVAPGEARRARSVRRVWTVPLGSVRVIRSL